MPKPRGNQNKKVKPVLHIFCEGEKTEPNYLNGYLQKEHSSNRLLKVIKVEKTKKNTPIQLVEEAIKLKKDRTTPDNDSFWVVYDREAISKYTDQLHRRALDKAQGANINVALTNVCFEIWLLLHFTDNTPSYSSCSELLMNSSLKNELKQLGVNDYDKADKRVFDLISDKITEARKRAVNMNRMTLEASYETEENPHLLNPYTGVHLLLDAIDDFVKKTK